MEYKRILDKDPALERRFQPVPVSEMTRAEALEVLRVQRDRFRQIRGVTVGDDVLEWLVQFADRFLRNRHFPDKAIDLLEQCIAHALVEGRDGARPGHVPRRGAAARRDAVGGGRAHRAAAREPRGVRHPVRRTTRRGCSTSWRSRWAATTSRRSGPTPCSCCSATPRRTPMCLPGSSRRRCSAPPGASSRWTSRGWRTATRPRSRASSACPTATWAPTSRTGWCSSSTACPGRRW